MSISASAERAAQERERRLERPAQSERIETARTAAGGIAHDFNNLLTAILGYTELLLSNRADDDAERADLEAIQKAGTRAASLTQQLLAFSRKQVLIPKDVDLNQAVTDLQSMLARLIREDITLECDLSAAPAIIRRWPCASCLRSYGIRRGALPAGGEIRSRLRVRGRRWNCRPICSRHRRTTCGSGSPTTASGSRGGPLASL